MRAVIVLDLEVLERAMPYEHQLTARVDKALELVGDQISEPGVVAGVARIGTPPRIVATWELE